MEHLVDCMITKVYEVKRGETEHGVWVLYNIYFNKGDGKKFGYMQGGKKPVPVVGMGIKHIEYEIEQKGQYTNYNVKKLEVGEESRERTQVENKANNAFAKSFYKNDNKDASFYVSYAKDLLIALIQADPKSFVKHDILDLSKSIVAAGLMMVDMVSGKAPEKLPDVPGWEDQEEDIQEEPTQEEKDRELRRKLKEYYKIDKKQWLKTLNAHTANKAEDVVKFEPDAQQAVLHDLAKEFKMKL